MIRGEEETRLFWPIQSMSDGDKHYGKKNEYFVHIWLSFDLFNLFVMFESFLHLLFSASCFYICFLMSLS